MNVEEIKAKFPNPIACVGPTPDGDNEPLFGEYCILGAAMMFKRNAEVEKTISNIRFPTTLDASVELGISYNSADAIADLNDAEKFESAWHVLDLALQGRGFKD